MDFHFTDEEIILLHALVETTKAKLEAKGVQATKVVRQHIRSYASIRQKMETVSPILQSERYAREHYSSESKP